MRRTRKMLALTGLIAVLLVTVGANAVAAETDPRSRSGVQQQAPIVWDHGLDSRPSLDSTSTLATCYGGAKSWDAGHGDPDGEPNYIPSFDDPADERPSGGGIGYYRASARCNDINLRITNYGGASTIHARVCFLPSSGGYYCNQGRNYNANDTAWHVIATDVLDGTRFEVRFDVTAPGRMTGAMAA
jgi:hypothetical protein